MNMPKNFEDDADPYNLWSFVPETKMQSENHSVSASTKADPIDFGPLEDLIIPDSYDGLQIELEDVEDEVESKAKPVREMTFIEQFIKIYLPMWDPNM